jgi:hypothetical protein
MSHVKAARSIISSSENITYPSRGAAQHVRKTMRGLMEMLEWRCVETDPPPTDGSHILVCRGPYSDHWGFSQSPPCVVHYFADPDEPGFYLSGGIVQDSYNDKPVEFNMWRHLGDAPR